MKRIQYPIPGTSDIMDAIAIAGDIHVSNLDGAASVTATCYDRLVWEAHQADPTKPAPMPFSMPPAALNGPAFKTYCEANPQVVAALETISYGLLETLQGQYFANAQDYTPPVLPAPPAPGSTS